MTHRLHIILLGACNSGKSTLINMLTGQHTSLVSDIAGTTTDAVRKPMEIPNVGAAILIDTAGFDDASALGADRVKATDTALQSADMALLFVGHNPELEDSYRQRLKSMGIPFIEVASKSDLNTHDISTHADATSDDVTAIPTSIDDADGSRERIFSAILRALPADFAPRSLLHGLVQKGDTVMLVMPQDIQAPVGRLILPQVQTIRSLLDEGCIPVCCTVDQMPLALQSLQSDPALIITDSQAFAAVHALTPDGVRLTSFSILLAAQKGDIEYFAASARLIPKLPADARILIAESCTHAPKTEDIGRVKIPALLRKLLGQNLSIEFVRGADFPTDLTPYQMIIQCGGCMFNRRYILSRVQAAKAQHVPMTNYGVAIAQLTGILSDVTLPS